MADLSEGRVASIVFAAGRGSRMVGYDGNKTLLPLIPGESIFAGEHSFLDEVLDSLPAGTRGLVLNHRAEDVQKEVQGRDVAHLFQPETNGTGGALLAARPFIELVREDSVIITMGDVPLIRSETYERLVSRLSRHELVVLAFAPRNKAQYGMLKVDGARLTEIVEWKYWRDYAPDQQEALRLCNAGVYAARRAVLLAYLDRLAAQPHSVSKERGGQWVTIREYFITDLVELMNRDGLSVGLVEAPEEEVMGVDTPEALELVQKLYAKRAIRPTTGR